MCGERVIERQIKNDTFEGFFFSIFAALYIGPLAVECPSLSLPVKVVRLLYVIVHFCKEVNVLAATSVLFRNLIVTKGELNTGTVRLFFKRICIPVYTSKSDENKGWPCQHIVNIGNNKNINYHM